LIPLDIKMKTKKQVLVAALAVTVALLSSGCSIDMKHEALHTPAFTRSGMVNLAAAATGSTACPNGAGGHVGWGRITLFAIPVVPIYVNGDGNAAIVTQIQDALTLAGYTPQTMVTGSPPAAKLLTCEVQKFRFSNYTYLFPIVPTWGGVDLKLSLLGADKSVLWTQEYKGTGATLNFFDGYTSACEGAMTETLNRMTADFAGDDFYNALNK
jgi:hypothetical protein